MSNYFRVNPIAVNGEASDIACIVGFSVILKFENTFTQSILVKPRLAFSAVDAFQSEFVPNFRIGIGPLERIAVPSCQQQINLFPLIIFQGDFILILKILGDIVDKKRIAQQTVIGFNKVVRQGRDIAV